MIKCKGMSPGNSVSSRRRNLRLLMTVSLVAFADDLTLSCLQSGKQGGRADVFVIVGHGAASPLLDRQPRLCAIQCLNLALFVYTEYDRLLRGIQVQTHHIGHLFQKLRIARKLEGFRAMGLDIVGAPNIVDRGLADALALCHGPATPVRHPRRFGLQGRIHDSGDLVDRIRRLSSPAGSDVPQTVQSLVTKALAPQNHRVSVHRQLLRNADIGLTGSGGQNDTTTQSHLLGSAVRRDTAESSLAPRQKADMTCPCDRILRTTWLCLAICWTLH